MQGQVFVPYTGIGGNNMGGTIMPMNLYGSTTPGLEADEGGFSYNLTWVFPGGIVNQTAQGVGWGYAVKKGKPCTDEDIRAWLKGELISDRGVNPSRNYTKEEVDAATDSLMGEDIGRLMEEYLRNVMDAGDITKLRDGYKGCVYRG